MSIVIKYIAGYVAHRFRDKYSNLDVPTENVVMSNNTLDWLQFISNGNFPIDY